MERTRFGVNNMAALILRGTAPDEAVPLAWPLVCGTRVAQRTRAIAFSDGELTVEVPESAWRSELAGYLPHYLHQLKLTTGIAVEKIRFVVSHEKER
jgi:hypothetical protein